MNKKGVLLINLGTPKSPSVADVRSYLAEFLNDPRVINIPWFFRQILLRGIILPTRPRKSAKAYQAIWQEDGSPLLINGQNLSNKLSQQLGDDFEVVLGMRYGEPSIASAVSHLQSQGIREWIVLPLFPQYSDAATGSAIQAMFRALAEYNNQPTIKMASEFYDKPWFIEPMASLIKQQLNNKKYDKILLSYHGLPVKQVEATHPGVKACKEDCPKISFKNSSCYRAQCFATTRALCAHLNFESENVISVFQSRLGRLPWIGPDINSKIKELYDNGDRSILCVFPSFISDCLETLEEIGIGVKEDWLAMGGADFDVMPCLNAQDIWVDSLTCWIKNQ